MRTRHSLPAAAACAALLLSSCASRSTDSTDEASAAPASAEAALAERLDTIFDDPKFETAHWGIRVEDLDGNVIYDRNGGKAFTPASNLKVFTTAAALDLLGPEKTLETTVHAVGEILPDGTLDGDLVITGAGDPSLGAWHPDTNCDSACLFPQWITAVRDAGITRINGNVVGDGRIFTREYYSGEWDIVDLPWWYAAGSSGLAMEENCFRTVIRPGENVGDPAVITRNPDTAYVTATNSVETVAEGGTSNADIVWRDVNGNEILYDRTIAIGDVINERGSVWDGPRYAAFLFMEALEAEGISVEGEAVSALAWDDSDYIAIERDGNPAPQPDGPRVLVTSYTSPPLSEQAKVINKVSHNFFADMWLRQIGLARKGEGSFDAGAEALQDWLADIGAPEPETFSMHDGSGLARMNFVQPAQLTHVLRTMRGRGEAGQAFYDSLSIAGVDGWIGGRLQQPETQGTLRAKTGFIGHVRTLSGYVTNRDGEEWVFSMMCNLYSVPTSEVSKAQDAACLELARFAGGEK